MNREMLLNEIMQLDFARLDLQLFLDTHPADRDAICQYNNLTEDSRKLRAEFESQYGPLSHASLSDEHCFTWIDEPSPWDRSFLEFSK